MDALLISLLTFSLLLISVFVVLIVLMQRTSQSGGMGSTLGGGAAESTFGAETNNVLTKGTVYGIIAFFVTALVLYLIYQAKASDDIEARETTLLVAPEESVVEGDSASETASIENALEVMKTEGLMETTEEDAVANPLKVDGSSVELDLVPISN